MSPINRDADLQDAERGERYSRSHHSEARHDREKSGSEDNQCGDKDVKEPAHRTDGLTDSILHVEHAVERCPHHQQGENQVALFGGFRIIGPHTKNVL